MIRELLKRKKLKVWLKNYQVTHEMVICCIIETHLLSVGQEVSIFDLNGHVLLPYIDKNKVSNKDYVKIIEVHAPLMIYNSIVVKDFPASEKLTQCIDSLEGKLSDNMHNPWIKLLFKAFVEEKVISKADLLDLGTERLAELEISRMSFDSICSKYIKQFQKTCLQAEQQKKITCWLEDKSRALNHSEGRNNV